MADAERDNAGVIAPPPLIFAGPLCLGVMLNRIRRLPFLPHPVARLVGLALLIAGIAGNIWFVVTFRRADTSLDPRKPVSRFVTWGPYRYSRNPGYTSLTTIYVGISMMANALWPLLLLPGVLVTMQRGVIEREERYLERRFGREYQEYKQRVRRWL